MAYGADAVALLVGVELTTASVCVYVNALACIVHLTIVACAESAHVRPDVRRSCSLIVLATSGVEEEHLVGIAVVVPVVVLEVHLALARAECPCHELADVTVRSAVRIVLAVVSSLLRSCDRTDDIERQLELTTTLCVVVVAH